MIHSFFLDSFESEKMVIVKNESLIKEKMYDKSGGLKSWDDFEMSENTIVSMTCSVFMKQTAASWWLFHVAEERERKVENL
jgi:hypothetical protein